MVFFSLWVWHTVRWSSKKTPLGESDTAQTGPVVSQGSISAVILSANNLGTGVVKAFSNRYKEVK